MSAAGSLSLRMHCREELKIKLITKGYDPDIAERALDRMEELVRDLEYYLQQIAHK